MNHTDTRIELLRKQIDEADHASSIKTSTLAKYKASRPKANGPFMAAIYGASSPVDAFNSNQVERMRTELDALLEQERVQKEHERETATAVKAAFTAGGMITPVTSSAGVAHNRKGRPSTKPEEKMRVQELRNQRIPWKALTDTMNLETKTDRTERAYRDMIRIRANSAK